MARRSSVEQLPAELLDELNAQIRDGRLTIDDLTAFLQARGAEVSRSAVGRHVQKYEHQLQRYREAQNVAGVWVQELGHNPDDKLGRLLGEMLKTVAFQTLAQMGEDGDEQPSPADLSFIARTIKDLQAAQKGAIENEQKIRAQVAKQLQAVEAEAAKAGERGIGKERLEQLRREIMGAQG